MASTTFDTLQYSERLSSAGMPPAQAKAQAAALRDVLAESLAGHAATTTGIAELKTDVAELKADVALVKTDMAELKSDVAELKTDVAVLKSDVVTLKAAVATLETAVSIIKVDLVALRHSMDGRFRLLYWMFGVQMTGVGTLLVKALL